ncbi:Arginase/deacetylase [Dentipellis sp. KUC8613]|nr:Arginase/deacetylase [Dentipellis sp. KUC8613]
MKVFYDEDSLLHNPPYEILDGHLVHYYESPLRPQNIKHELESSPSFTIHPTNKALDVLKHARKVHSEDYLHYLETAYAGWVADGGDKVPPPPIVALTSPGPLGQTAVLPEAFPHPKMLPRPPVADPGGLGAIARAGFYCFDLSCPITADTHKSALASARTALSAAEALSTNYPPHSPKSGIFALCRPPGHHAGTALCGGYCFLNNASIAARFLQDTDPSINSGSTQKLRIAILDIDYHHGNGTQEIFYEDPSVLYVSLHAQDDYPYYTGSKAETGSGAGLGCTHNHPLPRGTADDGYLTELQHALAEIREFAPAYVLVSLGVDTYVDDPISDFKLTRAGYTRVGRAIAHLNRPTLFVMEGGYHIETIGKNVRAVLEGFEAEEPV